MFVDTLEKSPVGPLVKDTAETPPDGFLGIVQEVGFSDTLALLEVRRPGETFFLGLWSSPRGPRVFRVSRDDKRAAFAGRLPPGFEPRGAPPWLVGARIVRVTPMEIAVLARGPEGLAYALTIAKRHITVVELGTIELESTPTLPEGDPRAVLDDIATAGLAAHRVASLSVLARATTRVERRIASVERDLGEMGRSEGLVAQAQWLIASASKMKRGAISLAYTEWTDAGPIEHTLTLDPARSPKLQVQAMFHRARRLRLGRSFAEKRLEASRNARAALVDFRDELEVAPSLRAIDEILARAKRLFPKEVQLSARVVVKGKGGAGSRVLERIPYRTYVTERGERILVGRSDKDNESLTFRVARPHDLFVHVRGEPGSHVVVPLPKNKTVNPTLLVDAALLAAHFSRAKDEAHLDIEYTPRKWVRKHKGSAAGSVWYERVSVLALEVDRARLHRLLEREDEDAK